MRFIFKLKIFKYIIILFLVLGLDINNCLAAAIAESLLSPAASIDNAVLQNSFNYLANQQSYAEYKAIFAINPQDKPIRSLKGDDLQEFLKVLKDIRSIIEIFSQSNSFEGLMNYDEEEFIDDFLDDYPNEVNFNEVMGPAEEIIEIIKNVLGRLESRQRVQPVMHKELVFRLKRKLETGLHLLKPSMPIKSINFNDQILAYLKPETLKQIIENISWDAHNPDDYSGQRKIILDLEQPIVLEGGIIINSLEIKGVVYRDQSKIFPPLQEKYQMLRAAGLGKDNRTAFKNKILLKGAMPFAAAKREYMILDKLYAKGSRQYDYPVGYGMYKNYTINGKQFGFVITGVENTKRKRICDWFFENYPQVFDLISMDKVRFSKLAVDLFEMHELLLREYGKELRRFHDSGFYHGYAHMLNISWDKEYENIVLNDFEASKVISKMPTDKRVRYKLMDLIKVYVHFISFITGDNELSELVSFSNALNEQGNPFRYFLEGYFKDDLTDFNYDEFIRGCVHPAVAESVDLLEEMDQPVVEKMFSIEGEEYQAFKYIDSAVFDEQAVLNAAAPQQAI